MINNEDDIAGAEHGEASESSEPHPGFAPDSQDHSGADVDDSPGRGGADAIGAEEPNDDSDNRVAVDSIDDHEATALIRASLSGHMGAVQVLLAARAEIDCKEKNGWAALMCAAKNGHEGVMQALLEAGAAVDSKSNNATTALIVAAKYGQAGAMQVLLKAGAEVDLKDARGGMALVVAANYGQAGAVRVLLEAGAEVDLKEPRADGIAGCRQVRAGRCGATPAGGLGGSERAWPERRYCAGSRHRLRESGCGAPAAGGGRRVAAWAVPWP